jgi:hypothetical protein
LPCTSTYRTNAFSSSGAQCAASNVSTRCATTTGGAPPWPGVLVANHVEVAGASAIRRPAPIGRPPWAATVRGTTTRCRCQRPPGSSAKKSTLAFIPVALIIVRIRALSRRAIELSADRK